MASKDGTINKVVYGGQTLIDLTSDTVSARTLLKGYTAHDNSGRIITGTYETSSDSSKVENDTLFLTNASVTNDVLYITKIQNNILYL